MRGATHCARRLKALFSSLRSKLGKVSPPAGGDPIVQLILGILSRDAPESKAREALDRIRGMVVDYNELRVIPPIELADLVGEYPDVRLKCEDITRALNRISALTHTVSLDHLLEAPPKEARAYLDRIDGLEAYTRARIRLLGLQQHAIPLDEAMWAQARQQQIVDGRCPLEEAQAFLERQIAEEDGLEFVALLRRQAWADMGAAVRRREVARIVSVPPDRTARNMLQLIGATSDEELLAVEPLEPDEIAGELLAQAAAPDRGKGAGVKRKKKAKPRPKPVIAPAAKAKGKKAESMAGEESSAAPAAGRAKSRGSARADSRRSKAKAKSA